jgi:hypothetical protein
MTAAFISRRGLLAGFAASWLHGAGWDKAFPNWSEDTVLKLLIDSPWAHIRTVKMMWYGKKEANSQITYKDVPGTTPGIPGQVAGGSPVGGIGTGKLRNKLPDTADLIFRWASALPIRQAKALYQARQEKQDLAKAAEMVEAREGTAYALEVFGVPTVAAHAGTEAISAKLKASAAIRTKTGRVIRPQRVDTGVTGEVLTSTLYFPREEPLSVEDREIEVLGDVQLFEFSEKFGLKDMRYLGTLEI